LHHSWDAVLGCSHLIHGSRVKRLPQRILKAALQSVCSICCADDRQQLECCALLGRA
jgi:hypothetical protein